MPFNASRARRIRPAGQPESLRYGQPVGARSGERLDLGGQLSAGVARVDHVAWLEQEQCGLGVGARTVLGPRGTTNSSRGPRTTSRSRIWMVSWPPSTRKNSSVSGCMCQVNSP